MSPGRLPCATTLGRVITYPVRRARWEALCCSIRSLWENSPYLKVANNPTVHKFLRRYYRKCLAVGNRYTRLRETITIMKELIVNAISRARWDWDLCSHWWTSWRSGRWLRIKCVVRRKTRYGRRSDEPNSTKPARSRKMPISSTHNPNTTRNTSKLPIVMSNRNNRKITHIYSR